MDFASSVNVLQAVGLAVDGAGAVFLMLGALSASLIDALRSDSAFFPSDNSQKSLVTSIFDLRIGGIALVFGFIIQLVGYFVDYSLGAGYTALIVGILFIVILCATFLIRNFLVNIYMRKTKSQRNK